MRLLAIYRSTDAQKKIELDPKIAQSLIFSLLIVFLFFIVY